MAVPVDDVREEFDESEDGFLWMVASSCMGHVGDFRILL